MSEPAMKRQPIDLDEFERRLRGSDAPPRAASSDPLAELARLVGTGRDPFAQVFDRSRAPTGQVPRQARPAPAPQDWAQDADEDPYAGQYEDPHHQQQAPVGLRGTLDGSADWHRGQAPQAGAPQYYDQNYGQPDDAYAPAQAYDGQGSGYQADMAYDDGSYAPEAEAADGARRRRPMLLLGSALGVILLALGGTFLLRSGSAGHRGLPTILAASGPNKIQPPEPAKADSAAVPSILDKDNADKNGPVKVVSQREEPVDLSQAVPQAQQASVAGAAPGPQAASDASAYPFGVPRRVHTIAVRPDGSFITDPQAPASAAAAPAPAPMQMASLAGTNAASPAPAPAAQPVNPPPLVPLPRAEQAKMPTRVAPAPRPRGTATEAEAGGPMQLGASATPARAPVRVASNAAEAPAASEGGFAVQLAAAGSEAEARSRMSEFARKYGSKFRGHHLGYHEGESGGRNVWRVRLSGLSQEDAVGICSDVKSAGGACFVARN